MRARIFQQPKTAMQSGVAGTDEWVLDWEPTDRARQDPLMGWFGSRRHAERRCVCVFRHARKRRWRLPSEGHSPTMWNCRPPRVRKPKVYADNFKYGRSENWTH